MTYLDLVNAVLVRLREKKVTAVDANPFTAVIGALVNDAKDSCEGAWNWSHLRQQVTFVLGLGVSRVIIADSYDNDYQINVMSNLQTGGYLRYAPQAWLRAKYRNAFNADVPLGEPQFWTWGTDDEASGNKTIQLYPPSNDVYNIVLDRVAHQGTLTDPGTRLLIPTQPVIQLATALASRERGEIGGTPTSELFILADRYLSDAIAYDTAKWEPEMDWYDGQDYSQTNVRAY